MSAPAPAPDTYHYTPGLNVGLERVFQDAAILQDLITVYFDAQEAAEKPLTMHGLARALGITRQTLMNYTRYTDQPSIALVVKSALARVAEWTEEGLWRKGQHPAGPIFSLKNNFGWKDTQDIQVNIDVTVGIQSDDGQRRGMLPDIVLQQTFASPDIALGLSPASEIPVTEARAEAKATPIEGVSPSRVK